MNPVRVIVV